MEEAEEQGMDIQAMMTQKAHELFAVCDAENKGFITKRDMQRLQQELPLNQDQLEAVFDSLDDDGNGFLTLDEFTTGFGSFIGIGAPEEETVEEEENVYENEHTVTDFDNDDELFQETMLHIGATGIVEDQDQLKEVWARLRRDEPEVLGHFEEFIGKMTAELKRTQNDYRILEDAMRSKTYAHDQEVQKLYDEMENQIKAEREKLLAEERAKERQLKEELEKELLEKDRQLQEILKHQAEMEVKLNEMNQMDAETRMENERLIRQKQILEDKLEHSQAFVEDTRQHIDSLRRQQKDEKRERARQAFQITEGIALERESLVKQLDLLRDVNKKLKDEKEESWAKTAMMGERAPDTLGDRMSSLENQGSSRNSPTPDKQAGEKINKESSSETATSPGDATSPTGSSAKKGGLVKQGSILSSYFVPGSEPGFGNDIDEDIECDDDVILASGEVPANYYQYQNPSNQHQLAAQSIGAMAKQGETMQLLHDASETLAGMNQPSYDTDDSTGISKPTSVRGEPVGANDETIGDVIRAIPTTPERVFKIVFVGDSGVGKSTFIHQFCNNEFVDTFSATIGVDFQVKSILVDGHMIALQLWDTAGQERFRAITKQYFRKADGVLIMYDICNETSFTNVRNWMESVQDGVELGTVIMLLGNKLDIAEEQDKRMVKEKDGQRLSEDYSAIFYETSAKSGSNCYDSMQAIAQMLQVKEDREMENAVTLREHSPTKKGCCS